MLKGDLREAGLPVVLAQLADGAASGCLHVTDPVDDRAKVYLRAGRVYAMAVPGDRPQLGSRLVSSGALGPEALAEALEAQRTELQGWRLGELLVHLGYVDQPIIEAFVKEQVRESMSDLLLWQEGTWRFRLNERTREDVAPPTEVAVLLADVDQRRVEWLEILEVIHGADEIPMLSAAGGAPQETSIDADAWALLCKVDGVRGIGALARDCGFTLYEAGRVVHALVVAGLLEVEDSESVDLDSPRDLVSAAVTTALIGDALAAPGPDADAVQGSIHRVSKALSTLLGPTRTGEDIFAVPVRPAPPEPLVDPEAEAFVRAGKKAERVAREAVRRAADAEELDAAQTELEAARQADADTRAAALDADHEAVVVDLEERREAARVEEALGAERDRLAVEVADAHDEALALEAERNAAALDQARDQAHDEAFALEAERNAAALAAAEQARLAAEVEAARLAADELVAQEERLAEQARLAEETRLAEAAEQTRLIEEAERLEDEARLAETARLAEEAEQARLAEDARLAEEAEQARLTEDARLAEEVEQARLTEQDRVDAEAARLAEDARLAEEAEQARLTEDARLAEEVEQARLTEQDRVDAEADTARQAEELQAAEQARLAERARTEGLRKAEETEHRRLLEEHALEMRLAREGEQRPDADAAAYAAAELSATARTSLGGPAVGEAGSEVTEDPVDEPAWYERDTDTASLLRELSSLGLDADPSPAPRAPSAPRPAAPAPKKRKGLFGR